MRLSNLALWLLGTGFVLVGLTLTQGQAAGQQAQARAARCTKMVEELGLTDLCLNTEARYVRHLSQADLFSAFQDVPLSLEHMPSGSIFGTRRRLISWRGSSSPSWRLGSAPKEAQP
jgi:hypothetical protein